MEVYYLFFSLFCSIQFSLHETKTISYTFDVRYISSDIYDGVWKEKILGINGQFPGPTVRAVVGDTLRIDVINSIQDGQNTSIHWHGIHQKGTPDMDGPGMIAQCPLKVGSRMRYTFKVEEPGTYWYHGHVNSQYSEGLWGVLIVENKPEVYKYQGEFSIALSDWYYQTAEENENWYLSSQSGGIPPYPDTIMLNGRGNYPCGVARTLGRRCNSRRQVQPVFRLNPLKLYRVRVINTSSRAIFNFSIDSHTLRPIEVDGVDVDRRQSNLAIADVAVIAPGQRYSFIIRRRSLASQFIIRADLLPLIVSESNINPRPNATITQVTARIIYRLGLRGVVEDDQKVDNELTEIVENTVEEIEDTLTEVNPEGTVAESSANDLAPFFVSRARSVILNEMLLTPYDNVKAPGSFDIEFVLNANFLTTSDGIRRPVFNSRPFKLPEDKPILYKVKDGDVLSEDLNVLTIPNYGSVVQIVINNERGEHPFHLHGHTFWVMGKGGNGTYDRRNPRHKLIRTGPRLDTVLVEPEAWVVIRFIADNPGVWALHCHIDWHNRAGMAVTLVEAPLAFKNTVKLSQEGRKVCRMHA